MDIQNYYLLLELSVDPPEEDPGIIEEAIKKKQSEWSRNRNHPTKGTLAQQHIGLLPDIRKVMGDADLRKKEAAEAQKVLDAQEKEKFKHVDRHLALLMSKGEITREEITGLALLHEVDEKRLRRRLRKHQGLLEVDRHIDRMLDRGKVTTGRIRNLAKTYDMDPLRLREMAAKRESEKLRNIDTYIDRCIRRGYMSTEELARLTRIYGMKEDVILRRVKCPVKNRKTPKIDRTGGLDKTVEKIIQDKMNIVGKSSLYDFLEISSEATLENLMDRAIEKESEIRRIGQRDAVITASGALAGHCITIFKNEENRRAYDVSLTLSRLGELDMDIRAAGLSGKIWPEYMNILMQTGIQMGLEIAEADEYILDFFKKEGWPIEKRRMDPEKKRLIILSAIGILSIIILAVVSVVSIKTMREMRLRAAWDNARAEAEKQPELEGREVILRNFVEYSEPSEYKAEAEKQIAAIHKEIRERDYTRAMEKADAEAAANNPEAALATLKRFLMDYPRTLHKDDIQAKITDMAIRIDDRDFEALKTFTAEEYEKRVRAYDAYLEKYPEGRHVEAVHKLIAEMLEGYFTVFQKDLSGCEGNENWEKCMTLCDAFIKKFKDTKQAELAAEMKSKYGTYIQRDRDLVNMKEKAGQTGKDYDGARRIFTDYLESNPELPAYLKRKIIAEIGVWDQKIAARKQMEKTWEETLNLSRNVRAPLDGRISRVTDFISTYAQSPHTEEARQILEQLNHQKKLEDERNREARENKEWTDTAAYARNAQISLNSRIEKVTSYISRNPGSPHVRKAGEVLAVLRQQKQAEDNRARQLQANIMRVQQETARVQAGVASSGGRFRDNGNGTITDTNTGRMWCMFDAAFERGQCVSWQEATEHIQGLRTGGYQDWRMPTVAEMETLLLSRPAFPANYTAWFWAYETFWHGWNKNAYIFLSKRPGEWQKDSAPVAQCGSALAVR